MLPLLFSYQLGVLYDARVAIKLHDVLYGPLGLCSVTERFVVGKVSDSRTPFRAKMFCVASSLFSIGTIANISYFFSYHKSYQPLGLVQAAGHSSS